MAKDFTPDGCATVGKIAPVKIAV